MSDFLKKLNNTLGEEFNVSETENGAIGYATTGLPLLDLNYSISSLRLMDEERILKKFKKAFYEDKLLAIKWLFFACDVREGVGERRLFRIILKNLALTEIEIAKRLLPLVSEYNRWDNLLVLLSTPLYGEVCKLYKNQIDADLKRMEEGKSVSLCAKWLPSINTSCEQTKQLAKFIAKEWGITQSKYRKILSSLRKHLNVVEVKASKGAWKEIDYEAVPSRANLIYNNAFLRNDTLRRKEYLEAVKKGEKEIHSGVLYPHDIVSRYFTKSGELVDNPNETLELLWRELPNLVEGGDDTICVCDTSLSMTWIKFGRIMPLDVAISLSIYFSERCTGGFKDNFITFSDNPQLTDLSKQKNLRDKIGKVKASVISGSTNIEAVFDLILTTAINNNLKQTQLPKNVLILSDMEFNDCATSTNYGSNPTGMEKLFNQISAKYIAHGYQLPRLIFWNLASRTLTIPLKKNKLGVALVSGFSPQVLKVVLSGHLDPLKCILETINSPRYDKVAMALKDLDL